LALAELRNDQCTRTCPAGLEARALEQNTKGLIEGEISAHGPAGPTTDQLLVKDQFNIGLDRKTPQCIWHRQR
jgi:hypothetical protein